MRIRYLRKNGNSAGKKAENVCEGFLRGGNLYVGLICPVNVCCPDNFPARQEIPVSPQGQCRHTTGKRISAGAININIMSDLGGIRGACSQISLAYKGAPGMADKVYLAGAS